MLMTLNNRDPDQKIGSENHDTIFIMDYAEWNGLLGPRLAIGPWVSRECTHIPTQIITHDR